MVFRFSPFVLAIFFTFLGLFFVKPASAEIAFDTIFDTDGKVLTSFGQDANTSRMAIQSDGKIVVVGNASKSSNYDWAIARYNIDGSLDTTFGIGGRVIKDFGFGDDSLNTVAIQTDGKIVVGGYSRETATTCSNNPNFTHTVCWTLARYNTDGSLDTGFGNGGVVFSSVRDGTDPEVVNRLAIQADGKIVAVGSAYNLGIVRYNTDGSEDFNDLISIPDSFFDPQPSFSPGGIAGNGTAVRIQQDGKILVVGNAGNHMFLLRLNQNNTFDTTFGVGGLRVG